MLYFRDGLQDMPSYDLTERDWKIKVNANESPLNLPPLVEERVMARLSHLAFNRYPAEEGEALREAIGRSCDLEKENVWLGNGSSEIIEKLFYAFGGPTHAIVYPVPSFSMYKIYLQASDAIGVPVELSESYRLDVDTFVQAVRDSRAALAVLCNPNNPTGGYLSLAEVEEIARAVSCALLIDEAYIEFAGPSASQLLSRYPHLMVARTFSKAYGLAACRVGYLLADKEIVGMVQKAYMPYHLNVLSAVTADIVFQMREEYEPRLHMIVAERRRMWKNLSEIEGLTVFPSATNFLLLRTEKAAALEQALAQAGIGVRGFASAPRLKHCLRLSLGTQEENDTIRQAIQGFMTGRESYAAGICAAKDG